MNKTLIITLALLILFTGSVLAVRYTVRDYASFSDAQLNQTVTFTHYNTSVKGQNVVFSFAMTTMVFRNNSFYDVTQRKTAELPVSHVLYCLQTFTWEQCWQGMVLNYGSYNQSNMTGYTVREQVRMQKANEVQSLIFMRNRALEYLQEQNRTQQLQAIIDQRMT